MAQLPQTISRKKKKNLPAGKSTSRRSFFLFGIPEKSIYEFTRYLSVMIRARISLVEALDVVRGQISHRRFGEILEKLTNDVKGGKSFASALANYPEAFDSLYIHLVEIGETAGILEEVLEKLDEYMEKRNSLKQKVRKALAYPVFIIGITILVLVFLLTVIVPTFAEMYADYNAALPAATSYVILLSSVLMEYFLWFLAAIPLVWIFMRMILKKPSVAGIKDHIMLYTPIVGSFYRKTNVTQFCQTLGTLLNNGIGLVEGLTITRRTFSNIHLNEAIKQMTKSIKQGKSLARSVSKTGLFPPVIVQMITVGEETSELSTMLLHIANTNQQEMDADLDILTSVLEPAMIVVIGLIIGVVIVSMYLPVFELMNVIQ